MTKRTYIILNSIWLSSALLIGLLISQGDCLTREIFIATLAYVGGILAVYLPTHKNSKHRLGDPYNE